MATSLTTGLSSALLALLALERCDARVLSLRGGGLFDDFMGKKSKAVTLELETDESKSLYALGCNVGRQLGDLDCFSPEEMDLIFAGMKDVLTHNELRVDLREILPKAASLFKARAEAKAVASSEVGAKALAAAAAEEGATTTASGLVVRHIVTGEGKTPGATDRVRVHYAGRLVDGTVFDSSVARGEPIEFSLEQVVPGWTEGLQLMREGGKAMLTIPPQLAYGERGHSTIPPRATLTFEVELLSILSAVEKPADATAAAAPGVAEAAVFGEVEEQ